LRVLRLDDTASDKTARSRGTHAERASDAIDEALVEGADAYLHASKLRRRSDSRTTQIPLRSLWIR
jgi:hypothetical protein